MSIKRVLAYLASLGTAGIFVYFTFRNVPLQQLWQDVLRMQWRWLIAVGAAITISHWIRAYRWKIIIGEVGPNVRVIDAFFSLMIGYTVNIVVPRLGEIIRATNLGTTTRTSVSSLIGTLVVERGLDVFTLLALLGLSFHWVGPQIESTFPGLARAAELFGLLAILLFAVLLLSLRYVETPGSGNFFSRFPLGDRIVSIVISFKQGIISIDTPQKIFYVLFWTVFIWGLYCVSIMLMYRSFMLQELYNLGVKSGVVIMTMSGVGVTIPAPGSIGSAHYFISQPLIKLYQVPLGLAVSFATVMHFVGSILVSVFFGVLGFLYQTFRKKAG